MHAVQTLDLRLDKTVQGQQPCCAPEWQQKQWVSPMVPWRSSKPLMGLLDRG